MISDRKNKKDIWEYMVRKSRFRPLLLSRPVVKTDHHSITVIPHNSIRVTGLILVLAGFMPLLLRVMSKTVLPGLENHIVMIFEFLGSLNLISGSYLLLRRDTITWPGFGNGIYIRQGFFFYSMVYYLELDSLHASLVLNRPKGGIRWFPARSNCVLILEHGSKPGQVAIAAGKARSELLNALNSLTAVIRGYGMESSNEKLDQTVVEVQLQKYKMRVHKDAINRSSMAIRSLRIDSDNGVLMLKRSGVEIGLWIILALIGLILLPMSWYLSFSRGYYGIYSELGNFFVIAGCLLFALIGGFGIYPGYDIQGARFESDKERLVIEYGVIDTRNMRPSKLVLNYNSLAAVQICPVYLDEFFTAYELNLVLVSTQDRRINLTGYYKLTRARENAARIAKEIGVELLDHTL